MPVDFHYCYGQPIRSNPRQWEQIKDISPQNNDRTKWSIEAQWISYSRCSCGENLKRSFVKICQPLSNLK